MVWTKEYREISGTVVGFLFHNDARWFGSDAIRLRGGAPTPPSAALPQKKYGALIPPMVEQI